ncbi:MAG: type II toxin-antitoxin system HicB family antitoxin [Rhodobacter sp.]|nr:type II toxin-antitoxin system HicB family antitoxin [Rhodobacter sp.]
MTTYIGVVEKDPDSAYGIWFPDIPGCFSAADREEDLFPNACRAIVLHLEGWEIPGPRGIGEIRCLERVRRVNERGAYLMSVPFLRGGGCSRGASTSPATRNNDPLTAVKSALLSGWTHFRRS